ncbi:dehydrogenase/reductase SDR family member 7 [Bombus impatiens]|uniref:Dehydrogenase/reductase SDR family member 7 n=1 Tax=Bombus impatiens TaxID=132113 RepID=A0A6P8LKM9_BOMIM|nr:dehydrogenase/reductase SDR family member 7 [Bombus impatiens]XP_033175549.1 dehydrogenase/reductase SDR family member 7 [Bombus impatiens]
MDLLAVIGFITIIYCLVYIICPWFLDCDLHLAIYEKFGKPTNTLRDKVVWITGASSGIGEHLAYVLAEAGCKLILLARREAELEKVKINCLQRNKNLKSSDIEVLALNICDINGHESALNNIIAKFGKLDILVNNAGRSQRALWENIDISVDKEMFDLNVFSPIALSRLVAKYFLKVGAGHFVFTSSIAGVTATPFSATYCANKFALHGYCKTFALEKFDKNIPITVVCPGPVYTNFLTEAFTDKSGEKYGENVKEDPKNKVSVERCATLMGIAIANKLSEVWICKPAILQLAYLGTYYPNIGLWIIKYLGAKFMHRLRDNKTTIKTSTKETQ